MTEPREKSHLCHEFLLSTRGLITVGAHPGEQRFSCNRARVPRILILYRLVSSGNMNGSQRCIKVFFPPILKPPKKLRFLVELLLPVPARLVARFILNEPVMASGLVSPSDCFSMSFSSCSGVASFDTLPTLATEPDFVRFSWMGRTRFIATLVPRYSAGRTTPNPHWPITSTGWLKCSSSWLTCHILSFFLLLCRKKHQPNCIAITTRTDDMMAAKVAVGTHSPPILMVVDEHLHTPRKF